MATTADLKKKYLQMAQNNQAGTSNYLNAQKNQSLNQASNVLAQKYSNPNANPNQSFYSYGAAKEGYDKALDPSLSAQYNKAMTDYMNYSNAQVQAQNYNQQRMDQQNQASLLYQQGQKYAPGQLKAMGLGNTGLSETSQVGLMNTYANILNQANRDYATNINQMYQDLASANRESAQNLDAQLQAYEQQKENKAQQSVQEQYNILANAISNIEDSDLLAKYMETYKNVVDPNLQMQYDYKQNILKQYADAQEEQRVLESLNRQYGITEDTEQYVASDISPSTFKFIGYRNPDSNQSKAINYIKEYASEIPNGTVVDVNVGAGNNTYLVYNGKLYKVDRNATKGYKGKDLAKLYDSKKGK